MEVTSIAGLIPVYLPGKEFPIKATVNSDVYEGLTIHLEQSVNMLNLHKMIADGQILSLSFAYTEAGKAEDG